jgi:hypothetical protein
MQPESGTRTWQWVVTIIVIIILIIIGIFVFRGNGEEPLPAGDANIDGNGMTSQEVNRIVMSDQFPGNVVYLSSVQLAEPGWVVIHKDNAGQPGEIIGSMYFEAGLNPGGRINLTESTVEGGVYYAMLHRDNGDKVFNESVDVPLRDSRGNIIMRLFRASASVGAEIKG